MRARSSLRPALVALLLLLPCTSGPLASGAPAPATSAPAGSTPAIFYVATTGSDDAPGTEAAPWRTLQKAADTVGAGATVRVRGGVYTDPVTITTSGSAAGGAITFESAAGERAILDGTGLDPADRETGLVRLENVSYVTVRGFEIRNYRSSEPDVVPAGIFYEGAGSHVSLVDNHVHDVETLVSTRSHGDAFGIAIYGTSATTPVSDLLVDGNEVDHVKTGSSESVAINGNVDGFAFTNNRVHDTNNIGLAVIGYEGTSPTPAVDRARNGLVADNHVWNVTSFGNPAYGEDRSADGLYVDGGASIVLERNVVHHVDVGIELASEHKGRFTSDCVARDNVVYRCNVVGVSIGGYDRKRGGTERCAVVNNTLFENDTTRSGTGEVQLQFKCFDNAIANNVVAASDQGVFVTSYTASNKRSTVDGNCYFAPAGARRLWVWRRREYTDFSRWREATGGDLHGLVADPLFVDAASFDLHLGADSPAWDAGVSRPDVGQHDVDGQPRVAGPAVDIGADEVQ